MNKEIIHDICNEFVTKTEDKHLDFLMAESRRYPRGSKKYKNANDEFYDELARIYNEDEDHEATRDANDAYKRWFNGEDNK